jgi:hypothetical protein
LWHFTDDPLNAVFVITAVEIFAFYPTFRKSWFKPHQELAFAYIMDALKYVVSFWAMESYSLTALLYPVFIVALQSVFIAMLLWRRRVLGPGRSRK